MAQGTTRRAAPVLADAIRAAVRAELSSEGYTGVTYEGVARRVRTSKPVLYRRYRTRAHMVFDALVPQPPEIASGPLAGPLRADLVALVRQARDRFEAIGAQVYRGLLAEADDDLAEAVVALTGSVGEQISRTVLAAAAARGEIGSAPIPDRVARLVVVMLRDELLFGDATDAVIDELVDTVYLPVVLAVAGPGSTGA